MHSSAAGVYVGTASWGPKFVVLSVLCLVQTAMLTGVHAKMVGIPEKEVIWNSTIEFMITGFLTALATVECRRSTIFWRRSISHTLQVIC